MSVYIWTCICMASLSTFKSCSTLYCMISTDRVNSYMHVHVCVCAYAILYYCCMHCLTCLWKWIITYIYIFLIHTGQCIQPTYPPDTLIVCDAVQRKWAFNSTSGRCGAISYSVCGQDREGYNVFDTEAECNRTCVRAEREQSDARVDFRIILL